VQGKKFTDAGVDSLEVLRLEGRKIPAAHREVYKTLGGTPHLDQNYTVYGELVQGLELIDAIAAVETDPFDRPIKDQRMKMSVLNRRDNINFERQLEGKKPKNDLFIRLFDRFHSKEVKLD